jgi:hypothetical protein
MLIVREVREQHEDAERTAELEDPQRLLVVLRPHKLGSGAAKFGACQPGPGVVSGGIHGFRNLGHQLDTGTLLALIINLTSVLARIKRRLHRVQREIDLICSNN